MKILFLSHHWTNNSHHSLHSGFQRLVQFAADRHEVALVTWGDQDGEFTEGRIRVITVRGGRNDYLFRKRIAISRKGAAMAAGFDAVHSLYDDCCFALPPNAFTTTFHVLPGVVRYHGIKQHVFMFLKSRVLQRRAMRNAASIACVSTNLLAAIPDRYRHKARFIPHGVDTGFWDPDLATRPNSPVPGDYILCVGSHGLDRNLLAAFIRSNPARHFVFVGLKNRLAPAPNIQYLYDVSDEELRNLYAGATLMIRPLEFATANNSILEALSMGKTVLASRIPGITDYLTDKTAIFIDTLHGRSLDNIESRRPDPEFVRQAVIDSFSWEKVLSGYIPLYEENHNHVKPVRSIQTHA